MHDFILLGVVWFALIGASSISHSINNTYFELVMLFVLVLIVSYVLSSLINIIKREAIAKYKEKIYWEKLENKKPSA